MNVRIIMVDFTVLNKVESQDSTDCHSNFAQRFNETVTIQHVFLNDIFHESLKPVDVITFFVVFT